MRDGFLVDTDGSMVKLESMSQLRAGGAPHDMDPNNFLAGTETPKHPLWTTNQGKKYPGKRPQTVCSKDSKRERT